MHTWRTTSDIDDPSRESQRFRPKDAWRVSQLDHFTYGIDRFVDLLPANDQWWNELENGEIISANLS
jgi:hypothetical protein